MTTILKEDFMAAFNNKNKVGQKKSASRLVFGLTIAALAFSGTALAVDKHEWEGGTVSGSYNGSSTHKIIDKKKSRAEWRFGNRSSTQITYTLTRKMKMGAWASSADRISIMQVLNQKDAFDAGQGSAPVNQLGIRRNGSKFEYYIVQGGQTCGGAPEPKKDVEHTIKVSYKYGGTPAYYITGKVGNQNKTVKCQKGKEQRVGKYRPKLSDDSFGPAKNNRPYYPKYGAYVTGSGKGGATIYWRK
jgi:hypothetical protein